MLILGGGEKDRDKAMAAWLAWSQLTEEQFNLIAQELLASIESNLRQSLAETLDTATPREVCEIEVVIETNLGESRRYTFDSIADAIQFLDDFDAETVLNDENGPALWEVEKVVKEINASEDNGSIFEQG